MTSDRYIKLGRTTALVSFLTGTAILLFYFISMSTGFAFVGLFFMMLAGLVNIFILLLLLFRVAKDTLFRKKLLATIGIMLLNVPVVILYLFLSGIIANSLRITFNNSTKNTLTDIHINGCSAKHIDKINAGESQTIWMKIPGDCAVNMDYLQNGIRKKADVASYITNEGGQQIIYNIGGKNAPF
jgi:hypothetical protein